jgi:hypothetical protein
LAAGWPEAIRNLNVSAWAVAAPKDTKSPASNDNFMDLNMDTSPFEVTE